MAKEKTIKEEEKLQDTDDSLEHKCVVCNRKAMLELDDGTFICDDCAQIQNELSL